MNKLRNIIAVLKTKSGRKLTILSVLLSILIFLIIMGGTFVVSSINEVSLLDSSIRSIPTIIDERRQELSQEYEVYRNDYIARGDLATAIYNNYDSLKPEERLELIRQNVNAINATLLNSNGKMIASTKGKKLSRVIKAAYAAINEDPEPLFDPNREEGFNDAMDDEDGYDPDADSMPMVYDGHPSDGNILMIEFDYTNFGHVLAEQDSWDGVCQRALAGMDGYAFIKYAEGSLGGYPLDGLSDEQNAQLIAEVQEAFSPDRAALDLDRDDGVTTYYTLANFLGTTHLVAKLPADVIGFEVMLAVPINSFAGAMASSAVAIIVLVAVGFILFSRYAIKSFRRDPIQAESERQRKRIARKRTFAGIGVMLIVTAALSAMLLMLEGMSNTARLSISQQESIKYEVDYRKSRKKNINKEYSERYCTMASAMARILSDYPELRTRETLQHLATASKAEYLMLFDKDGNELLSSNGFTGFSVNDESTGAKAEWKPVLQGYGQVETPTQKNDVTGAYERTIATLVEDANGLPDGMLVMVVNDDGYKKEIGDATLEGTVKTFATRVGQVAAVVDNESGKFTAHTIEEMNGEVAANYLSADIIGRDYEGFSIYSNENSYISGVSSEGKTTLVITSSAGNDRATTINWYLIGAMLLLILLIFYPAAASLCSKYVRESVPDKKSRDKGHPMMTFYRGYVAYLAILAAVSITGVLFGFWTAFEFVFVGKWTPGIHLFAIWSALFTFAVLSYITLGLHKLIRRVDEQVNTHTRTFARLADSLITYAIAILMVILILTDLGVDTATIIGSVSIVSIAIGMGTQDLVKDIVAGLFLIFEGTIAVGDIVEIGGWHGRVTDMGIRTTEITNDHNDVKILTNSKIGDVVNLSRVKTACTEEFTIPRTVDVDALPELVVGYINKVVQDIPEIKDTLQLDEITSITETEYTVRLSYLVNEADRESATIRLRNGMRLLLEAENKEEVAE